MSLKNICFASLETGFWLTLNLFELWFWCFWAFLFQSYFGRKWSEKSHDTTISAIRKCIFWQGKEAESGSQSKFGGGLCSSESERRPREKLFNKSSLAFVEVALALISNKTAFLKKNHSIKWTFCTLHTLLKLQFLSKNSNFQSKMYNFT